ncbi:MAG: UDP-N-acetylmuramate dehydrogenase [bacterium]
MISIKKNISLAKHTTFKIGGPAKYFFAAQNANDLAKAIKWAKENKVSYFIFGGGSNLLVSDKGYGGLIIKIKSASWRIKVKSLSQKLKVKSLIQNLKVIEADAGVLLSRLVAETIKNNLTGIEWAAGIPGTVGGAVVGNAGAFGQSMADIVESVKVLDTLPIKSQKSKVKSQNYKSKVKSLINKDCEFGYRNSIFKYNKDLIILSVELRLRKRDKTEIQKKINKHLNYRKKAQPLEFSAGSVFKNIEIASLKNKNILRTIPEEKIKGGKFPAGYLIEKVGLRGKKQSQAQIAEKHANFIVNLGGAKAQDVIYLINLAKRKVKKKFGIELEEEIKYLGF